MPKCPIVIEGLQGKLEMKNQTTPAMGFHHPVSFLVLIELSPLME